MRNRALRKVTARYTWDRLKVSFWFTPLVMSLGAVVLVWAMNWLDRRIPNELLQNSNLVLSGSADQARATLVSMATSILTTAGVVFTLLTLPLSTVAAQYGSRLLRLFLSDRITQFVLGMFVGTFVYCITAATSIPSAEAALEAPQVLVTVGLLLMMATFGSLILLVQHISTMLQAPQIAAAAGAELLEVVQSEVLDEVSWDAKPIGQPAPVTRTVKNSMEEGEGYPVRSPGSGYIQYIDPEYMLTLAQEKNLVVRLLRKPGDFVWPGEVVALVWPSDGIGAQRTAVLPVQIDQEMAKELRRAFRLGKQRTPAQDVECAINQLVEMAVRAMSPAINDPLTAMTCLDYMGQGLALFAQKREEYSQIYDRDGRLRLVFEPVTFDQLLSAAFDMLRHCSSDNASVLLHMLDVIGTIGQETKSAERCNELLHHASLIQTESKAAALTEPDRQHIIQCVEALQLELNNPERR